MIANFFKKRKPIHTIFIVGLFLLYYILAVLFVEKPVFSIGLALEKTGALLLFLGVFFLIQFINKKNYLSEGNSYVLLILVFLFGIFPKTMEIQNIFYAHFFLLLSFRRIYSLKTAKDIKEKTFDSALWIGVAALFYSWSILFLLLVIVALFIWRKLNIRTLFIPVVGFFTPIFLVFTYYFSTTNLVGFYKKIHFDYHFTFTSSTVDNYLVTLLLIIFLIVAIITIGFKLNLLKNALKYYWIVIISHFIIALFILIIAPQKNNSEILFLFFPFAIITANFIQLFDSVFFRDIILVFLFALSFYPFF